VIELTLKVGRERSVLRRHPWILSGAVAGVEGDEGQEPGAEVLVRSAKGQVLGYGHYSPASQIRVRLLAFGAVAAPLYFMQGTLGTLMPGSPWVDPITLTCFALVLGTLYYRTHRIVPSIVLHMALNATSVAMAWWFFSA
jgi:hypothetical protein